MFLRIGYEMCFQIAAPTPMVLMLFVHPERAGDLRESSADISKARDVLGYEPQVQLTQGLAGVVRFFSSGRAA